MAAQPSARSIALAIASSVPSPNGRVASCRPTGSGSAGPHGTEIAGACAALKAQVFRRIKLPSMGPLMGGATMGTVGRREHVDVIEDAREPRLERSTLAMRGGQLQAGRQRRLEEPGERLREERGPLAPVALVGVMNFRHDYRVEHAGHRRRRNGGGDVPHEAPARLKRASARLPPRGHSGHPNRRRRTPAARRCARRGASLAPGRVQRHCRDGTRILRVQRPSWRREAA